MNASTLRRAFLDHLQANGHAIIGGAPLLPEHDPSVLFTTAGMHPLVPYLLGEPHPAGKRLANVQKCLRTNDILEVGDPVHLTFFEMLGNWSLGDYWKHEAIRLSYTFLTERLGFDTARLYVTVFAGDTDAPRDEESAQIWREFGIPERRISYLPKEHNWWGPVGSSGPCGPDSEMFFDTNPTGPPDEHPGNNPPRFWEVGNNVFMQYDLQPDGRYLALGQHNVDLGMGLDRLLPVLQGVESIYETDLFLPVMEQIRLLAQRRDAFAERVVADHTRAALFVLVEGVRPGNTRQPYIVRRLIRRAVRYGRELGIAGHFMAQLAEVVIPTLSDFYGELEQQRAQICSALEEEETRFGRTLARGEAEFARTVGEYQQRAETMLPGTVVFDLYQTYGFPAELTEELAQQRTMQVDMQGFADAFAAHQQQSRHASAGQFRGGLAERLPETTRLHTATHLLHAALRQVLGEHVAQRGSHITSERLRFDFSHPERVSPEQLATVEQLVNTQIARDLPVAIAEMSVDEAYQAGAIGLFEARYGERVKVYTIGDWSKEICGGPHVMHTGGLGHFRITKEEAVSAGVRRVRAVLEDS